MKSNFQNNLYPLPVFHVAIEDWGTRQLFSAAHPEVTGSSSKYTWHLSG